MNHESKWKQHEREAGRAIRELIGTTWPRRVEFKKYDSIDATAVLTELSRNVLVYVVENNPETIAIEKTNQFLKCLNCDLKPILK